MKVTEIDFVLVSEASSGEDVEKQGIRDVFERNLAEEGLNLEREELEGSKLYFTKVNAPLEVLRRYSEILKLCLPMKEQVLDDKLLQGDIALTQLTDEVVDQSPARKRVRFNISEKVSIGSWFRKHVELDQTKFPPETQRLTYVYSRDKEYLFDISEPDFFKEQVRARIVDFIIKRTRFSDDASDEFAVGIDRLISDKVYYAAYPLHDGDLKMPGSVRNLLYTEWASLKKFCKHQPLDVIKEYFGVQIGLYYAWLGYYTQMLIPASILGFLCFVYGCFSRDTYSQDICEGVIDKKMCPMCGHVGPGCNFWDLKNTCTYAKVTHMFDNNATVVFAILMSFWAAIFLEFWKRYSAQITHKWDLSGMDKLEEPPRLEFLTRLKKLKKSGVKVVGTDVEPKVSFWKTRVPYTALSLSIVLLMVTMAAAVVVAIISYRVAVRAVLATQEEAGSKEGHKGRNSMIVTASSACLNLVIIVIFNNLYAHVAQYLTELEMHRSQTEYDDSLTLKIYALQFVNFYSSIFYIAFFKGRYGGPPHKPRPFLIREECSPAGCMADLCIQLAIIMVGKQFVNAVIEMTGPLILKWIGRLRMLAGAKKRESIKFKTQWARDVKLLVWHSRSLFSEYLEMVLQYGFITIFVVAFPLAPFFALLNNIMEMRLDATKMLMHSRRPVGLRVKSIGVWSDILQTVSKIAIISNALIIAFTSSFIPRLVFYYERGTTDGFLDFSLTSFNTSLLLDENGKIPSSQDEPVCWYFANHYNSTYERERKRYTPNSFYWEVLTVRLAFVVIFQNVVNLCVLILKGIIPDVPKKLQEQMRREAHLTNEIIIKQEMLRAKELASHTPGGGLNRRGPTPKPATPLQRSQDDSIEMTAINTDGHVYV